MLDMFLLHAFNVLIQKLCCNNSDFSRTHLILYFEAMDRLHARTTQYRIKVAEKYCVDMCYWSKPVGMSITPIVLPTIWSSPPRSHDYTHFVLHGYRSALLRAFVSLI